MSTGQTSSNTTWGGLNPGQYQIIVWDALNDSIFETVEVDSINPEAILTLTSSGLTHQGNDIYWGEAGVNVEFESTSTGVYNFNDPNSDTSVFW